MGLCSRVKVKGAIQLGNPQLWGLVVALCSPVRQLWATQSPFFIHGHWDEWRHLLLMASHLNHNKEGNRTTQGGLPLWSCLILQFIASYEGDLIFMIHSSNAFILIPRTMWNLNYSINVTPLNDICKAQYTFPKQTHKQNKHVFPPLFWHDTLVFKWWHYHITKNSLALQPWVNSVSFHMLNKLLGIWTHSLGMNTFQIKSKSLWSSPLHTFLHGERANLLRQLEDTSAQWFLVSICLVSPFWDQNQRPRLPRLHQCQNVGVIPRK